MNGFAGVDYNSPEAPHEEIERSIRAMFSTGVTRFFPTVITGAPERMLGALRNLARLANARIATKTARRWRRFTSKGRTSPPKRARAARIPPAG